MSNITLKQLSAFVKVAELGSFRKAAEHLNTTQPNISARISALESQLAVQLMIRGAGAVQLTHKGLNLLDRSRDVLSAIDAVYVAAGDDSLIDGVLRLGVTEMIVHSFLGPYLRGLKTRFPNVSVDLVVDLSSNLTASLADNSIDLALQSGPFSQAMSGNLGLGSYAMIWVGSSNLDLSGKTLTLSDIAAHSVLTHARGTLPFQQLDAHFRKFRNSGVKLVPSTNMAACLQMTIDGLGIACLPEAMVRTEIHTGALVQLDYPWVPDALQFFARYDAARSTHHISQAAQIAQTVAAQFDDNPNS